MMKMFMIILRNCTWGYVAAHLFKKNKPKNKFQSKQGINKKNGSLCNVRLKWRSRMLLMFFDWSLFDKDNFSSVLKHRIVMYDKKFSSDLSYITILCLKTEPVPLANTSHLLDSLMSWLYLFIYFGPVKELVSMVMSSCTDPQTNTHTHTHTPQILHLTHTHYLKSYTSHSLLTPHTLASNTTPHTHLKSYSSSHTHTHLKSYSSHTPLKHNDTIQLQPSKEQLKYSAHQSYYQAIWSVGLCTYMYLSLVSIYSLLRN